MSPDRVICTRAAVTEKVLAPGGSANMGGQITTFQEEKLKGKGQGQRQVQ